MEVTSATTLLFHVQAQQAAVEPLSGSEWDHVVSSLGLSPQQARIVELILAGLSDTQVAMQMNVRVPTVRTYLTRVFQRTGTAGRVELVMLAVARAREWRERAGGQSQ